MSATAQRGAHTTGAGRGETVARGRRGLDGGGYGVLATACRGRPDLGGRGERVRDSFLSCSDDALRRGLHSGEGYYLR